MGETIPYKTINETDLGPTLNVIFMNNPIVFSIAELDFDRRFFNLHNRT